MPTDTKQRILNACSITGLVTLIVTLLGWLVAGVLPLPLGPSHSTRSVVDFYSDGGALRMVGLVVAQLGIAFTIPLVTVITIHLLRVEGRIPILAFVQMVAGTVAAMLLILPMMLFAIIAFRPDALEPGTIRFMNDLAWLLFLTPIAPFMIQNISIGVCILTNQQTVFPRWVGYANFWIALSFVPDVLAYFFYSGPLAWNGVVIFWLALTTYAIFLVMMSLMTMRANRELVASSSATVSNAVPA
ncbi:hypothetical protein [Nocardia sp. NPDC052112]|uniref:hypothetical protein n=1 Tax=Nocardia sp. NPDC052112 TaxID=3155646 RepID=UPI003415619B